MKKRNGFTLIEMVVTISIVGVLSAVLIPGYTYFINKANKTTDEIQAKEMSDLLSLYAVDHGQISSREEAIQLLKENFGNSFSLEPKSANLGYHYFLNLDTYQIEFKNIKSIYNHEETVLASYTLEDITREKIQNEYFDSRYEVINQYMILDTGGSILSSVLNDYTHVNNYEDFTSLQSCLYNLKSSNDGVLYDSLEKKFESTVFVTDEGIFRANDSLEKYNVVFSEEMTRVPDKALQNISLNSFVMPNHITTIGKNAFSNCDLSGVILSNGLKADEFAAIQYQAFKGNDSIKVYVENKNDSIENIFGLDVFGTLEESQVCSVIYNEEEWVYIDEVTYENVNSKNRVMIHDFSIDMTNIYSWVDQMKQFTNEASANCITKENVLDFIKPIVKFNNFYQSFGKYEVYNIEIGNDRYQGRSLIEWNQIYHERFDLKNETSWVQTKNNLCLALNDLVLSEKGNMESQFIRLSIDNSYTQISTLLNQFKEEHSLTEKELKSLFSLTYSDSKRLLASEEDYYSFYTIFGGKSSIDFSFKGFDEEYSPLETLHIAVAIPNFQIEGHVSSMVENNSVSDTTDAMVFGTNQEFYYILRINYVGDPDIIDTEIPKIVFKYSHAVNTAGLDFEYVRSYEAGNDFYSIFKITGDTEGVYTVDASYCGASGPSKTAFQIRLLNHVSSTLPSTGVEFLNQLRNGSIALTSNIHFYTKESMPSETTIYDGRMYYDSKQLLNVDYVISKNTYESYFGVDGLLLGGNLYGNHYTIDGTNLNLNTMRSDSKSLSFLKLNGTKEINNVCIVMNSVGSYQTTRGYSFNDSFSVVHLLDSSSVKNSSISGGMNAIFMNPSENGTTSVMRCVLSNSAAAITLWTYGQTATYNIQDVEISLKNSSSSTGYGVGIVENTDNFEYDKLHKMNVVTSNIIFSERPSYDAMVKSVGPVASKLLSGTKSVNGERYRFKIAATYYDADYVYSAEFQNTVNLYNHISRDQYDSSSYIVGMIVPNRYEYHVDLTQFKIADYSRTLYNTKSISRNYNNSSILYTLEAVNDTALPSVSNKQNYLSGNDEVGTGSKTNTGWNFKIEYKKSTSKKYLDLYKYEGEIQSGRIQVGTYA